MRSSLLLLAAVALACGSTANSPAPGATTVVKADAAVVAKLVATLQAGHFDEAFREANTIEATTPNDATTAAVRAIARYQRAGSTLRDEVMAVLDGFDKGFDHPRMRKALADFELSLAAVQGDLRVASAEANLALDLCLACWEHDWNHSGEVDSNDRLLFQVEVDVKGNQLPDDDARRRPTFRFDVGDTHWALAMMSFQRAFINVILAYEWTELDALAGSLFGPTPNQTIIRLGDAKKVTLAKELILEGLAAAETSRQSYLAETDDHHEWLPSPTQGQHSIPLPVDAALYQLWADVLVDVGRIVKGEEGLSVPEMFQLGDTQHENPPGGFIDVGRMLREPGDIIIEWKRLEAAAENDDSRAGQEQIMKLVFRGNYVSTMKRSPLLSRMLRMAKELDNGSDSLERKLRYMLWLN